MLNASIFCLALLSVVIFMVVGTMPESISPVISGMYTIIGFWALSLALCGFAFGILPHLWRKASEDAPSRSKNGRSMGRVESVNSPTDVLFKVLLMVLVALAIMSAN